MGSELDRISGKTESTVVSMFGHEKHYDRGTF